MAAKVELKRAIDFVKSAAVSPVPDVTANFDTVSQKLRWFVLPCEAAAQLRGEISMGLLSDMLYNSNDLNHFTYEPKAFLLSLCKAYFFSKVN